MQPIAAQVSELDYLLSWSIPTQYADGAPLALEDVVSYRLYARQANDNWTSTFVTPNTTTTYAGTKPEGETWCWRISSVDIEGLESQWSDSVCKTFGAPVPPSPHNPRTQPAIMLIEVE